MSAIKRIFFSATIMALGMFACTYETLEPEIVVVPEEVSFSVDVIPIFNKSCNISGCHSTGGIAPDLSVANAHISLTFFGYVDIDSPEISELYKAVNSGTMKRYATDQDRAIMLKWIEQGALDN